MNRDRILKIIDVKFPNITDDMKEEYFTKIIGNIRKDSEVTVNKEIKEIKTKERIYLRK